MVSKRAERWTPEYLDNAWRQQRKVKTLPNL
jgi:hypothetical protein